MMLALSLALAAASPTVIDAERAFAQMAQDKGQWTAFRGYAAPDAVMFVPQPVNAQEFLKDKKDPPKAIRWQPTHAWVSCDGTLAIDTGNWQGANGKVVGYFTTVWKRQADSSWKWVYDGGDALTTARAPVAKPTVVVADCKIQTAVPMFVSPTSMKSYSFVSKDGTLMGFADVNRDGSRSFIARAGVGGKPVQVLTDNVAAPAK